MTLQSQQRASRMRSPDLEKVRVYLVSNLSQEMEANPPPLHRRRERINELLNDIYAKTQLNLAPTLRDQIFRDVIDDILGYGPIQPLLDDSEITEVMVNGPKQVYVERAGKLVRTNVAFENDEHIVRIIEKIIQAFFHFRTQVAFFFFRHWVTSSYFPVQRIRLFG